MPYVPRSHPIVERLIGTVRRECLDRMLFWTAADLERKLVEFEPVLQRASHACGAGRAPASADPGHGWRLGRVSGRIGGSRTVDTPAIYEFATNRLRAWYPTPGYCEEEMSFFRATGLRVAAHDSPHEPDADEDIAARSLTIAEARAMVKRGEMSA